MPSPSYFRCIIRFLSCSITAACLFIFFSCDFIIIQTSYTGWQLLSEGILWNLQDLFLYLVLWLGGIFMNSLFSSPSIRLSGIIMQILFFMLYTLMPHHYPLEQPSIGFKICFILTVIHFILTLVYKLHEQNNSDEKLQSISILLSLFFGPFGLFYSTKKGAFFMLLISCILLMIVGIITHPNVFVLSGKARIWNIYFILFAGIQFVSTIWGMIAVHRYNQRLINEATQEWWN